MKYNLSTLFWAFTLVMTSSCKQEPSEKIWGKDNTGIAVKKEREVGMLIEMLRNSNSNEVMVIAHRGDWRNAPENSLQAIQNCIDMGVDMVELDVRRTKDGELVIMHDRTLDRTTTGSGNVSNYTLDSLKTFYLKNGVNHPTSHKIPTLREALETAKGKVLINLDKCYGFFDEAYEIINETGTTRQVLIKGFNKTVEEVKNDVGKPLDSIWFMPVINLDKHARADSVVEAFQNQIKPVAFEFVFATDTSSVLQNISGIKRNGSRVWVNSLWGSLNANHDDDLAVENADSIYGWYINQGINMIQTDRPRLLLHYLRNKNLHD